MTEPLVSCVCPTMLSRGAWLVRAIACFQVQTYANRELLVVSEDFAVADLLPSDPRIRFVPAPSGLTLGAKRNVCNEATRGEIIAHVDDDDWFSADRLLDQAARLEAETKLLTGYSRMKFTDGRNWWQYVGNGNPGHPMGTSLMYRKALWKRYPFSDHQVGSDNVLCCVGLDRRQATVVDAGNMMGASVHGAKTNKYRSAEKMMSAAWKPLDPSEGIPEMLVNWPVSAMAV